MVKTIKGVKVTKTVTEEGRCPYCKGVIIAHDKAGYTVIKNRSIFEFDTGGQALLCKCGQYVNRS